MTESEGPILHVIVIGFHHKKGCQVEYAYPSLTPEAPNECPLSWKYLPTLALPDGSHNFDADTVFFHLPSLTDPKCTVYGISCFKQIPVEKLKNRTSDITRETVQKSVCVLSTLPFYGHIQVKIALITDAYFEEGDFSKVSLLKDTYHHLNFCMNKHGQISPQVFEGLSARDFILQFRHKVLLLFKLLLLEKRVIFFQSPVHPLCTTILTLLSLYPGMIECGLKHATYIRLPSTTFSVPNTEETSLTNDSNLQDTCPLDQKELGEKDILLEKNEQNFEIEELCKKTLKISEHHVDENVSEKTILEEIIEGDGENKLSKQSNNHLPLDTRIADNILQASLIDSQKCGLPLCIFSEGYLCLPYLSLPYLELLSDKNVRGYVVGASNILFKQKKQLIDVLIDVESGRIEANDPELRRQLHLTTEDLRFIDYVIRCVVEARKETFLDNSSCEGGDEWIRTQFKVYLLHSLRTSLQYDTRETDHFNSFFMTAWRSTNNYKIWTSAVTTEINSIEPGHPFAGQLSVQDMKLRLSHSMQSSESGRKLNQAMLSTGRAVATTGKAVGGALSQAKVAFSSWWNTLTTVQPISVTRDDNLPEEEKAQVALKIEKNNPNLNEDFLTVSLNCENIMNPN